MSDKRARWRERSRIVRVFRLLRNRHPVSFRDKVRYKMLRDHRPLLVTFADKAAVRDYVAARIGAEHLPRALALVDDPSRIAELDLPPSFVMKPTHGSGAAVAVSPAAPEDATLPPPEYGWVYTHVRPAAANAALLAAIAADWSWRLYGQGPNREWAYGQVRARVIVEEMLVGENGDIPDDYKFFVFHGICRFIQVDAGRFAGRTQDFYAADWAHLPMSGGHPWIEPPRPRPVELERMIEIAQTLAAETDFVRVDLYRLPDRIVFGELTSYPAGGNSPFDPEEFDLEFGRHWTVPRRYL